MRADTFAGRLVQALARTDTSPRRPAPSRDPVAELERKAAELLERLHTQAEETIRSVVEAQAEAGPPTRAPTNVDLAAERARLERTVDELRTFEREYRARLRMYLDGQLREVDESTMDLATAKAFAGEYQARLKAYLESRLRALDPGVPGEPDTPRATGHVTPQVDPALRDQPG
jgi:hypothetical protein